MATLPTEMPTKRRGLPPLNTSEPENGPAKPAKGKKKKKNVEATMDASDSQLSTTGKLRGTVSDGNEVKGQMSASTEDMANVTAGGSKRKKKKRRPPEMPDGNVEEDEGTQPIENLKASPGAARRKRGKKSNMPRSVSDEIVPETNGSAKQKSRRPKPKVVQDDSGADGEEGSGRTPSSRPPTGKAKKKKKAKPLTSGDENYHADGEDLLFSADDIVTGEVQVETAAQPPASQVTVLPSQPVNKLFMERKGGFASEDKKRLIKRRDRERRLQQDTIEETAVNTTQCALNTHRFYLTFSLFCHGLLAGYALWQCVVVFVLSNQINETSPTGQDQFLAQYSRIAMPASSIYYFLFAICTVSVFDRFDIARPDRQFFRGLLTFQSGAVSILVYLISLIFSVSITSLDDRISLYLKSDPPFCDPNCPEDGALWADGEAANRLTIWRIINVIRAVGSILGWLIIAITPTTDYTSDHMHDADVPLWEEQQETEMSNVAAQP